MTKKETLKFIVQMIASIATAIGAPCKIAKDLHLRGPPRILQQALLPPGFKSKPGDFVEISKCVAPTFG